MEFNMQFKTISVFKILEIIDPMIKSNFDLETKYQIIQGLKEMDLKVFYIFSSDLEFGIKYS
jgi:hypothetical protein